MTTKRWVSMTEAHNLYGRPYGWLKAQIERHNLETRSVGRERQVRLQDLIDHEGEPPTHILEDTAASDTPEPETTILESIPVRIARLEQENRFLRERIAALETDKRDGQKRIEWLERIIERQTLALPVIAGGLTRSTQRSKLTLRTVRLTKTVATFIFCTANMIKRSLIIPKRSNWIRTTSMRIFRVVQSM